MIESTLDILYLVLAIGSGLMLIALTMLILETIRLLKRINTISEYVEHITDTMSTYVKIPATLIYHGVEMWKKHMKAEEEESKKK